MKKNSQYFSFFSRDITQLSIDIPLFNLKSGTKNKCYSDQNYIVSIIPSKNLGMPTIFDKDIWIYCLSQLRGGNKSKAIQFAIYDYLLSIDKSPGGKQYELVRKSLKRLEGTYLLIQKKETGEIVLQERFIKINEDYSGYGYSYEHLFELSLPDCLYQLSKKNKLIKIHHRYFKLKKALTRRIYEISLMYPEYTRVPINDVLFMSGSNLGLSEFKRHLKIIALNEELSIVDTALLMFKDDILFFRIKTNPYL